jgi:hypothetical protein
MVEYDDGTYNASLGRMVILSAPTIGTIDGASFSRKLGKFRAGVAVGFLPDPDLQSTDTERKRVAVYVAAPDLFRSTQASVTYAKTWYQGASEREVISANTSSYLFDGFSFYTMANVDLRVPSGGSHILEPALSLLLVNATARISRIVGVSLGFDASRSLLPFSYARLIPDTLRDRRLRSGLHAGVNISLPFGVRFTTTFSPRSSGSSFGSEYSEYSSLSSYNMFGTGVGLRATLLLTSAAFSKGTGIGFSASRSIAGIDVSARVQQTQYRLTQTDDRLVGWTTGIDILVPIVSRLTAALSADRTTGFGPGSLTLFGELSYRF